MAKDVTQDRFGGLLVPDDRVTLWEAQSSYTTASPRAGVPDPGQTGSMALSATGTQSVGSALTLRCQRGGFPVRRAEVDGVTGLRLDNGATFVWKRSADTLYKGWDPPRNVAGFETILYCDAGFSMKYVRDPHAVTLSTGVVLCCYETRDTSYAGAEYAIEIESRSTTGTWTRLARPYTTTTAPVADMKPCLCLLPSGRVCLFFWVRDTVAGAYLLRGYFSDDSGTTWGYLGDGLGNKQSAVAITRTRAAYKDGQICLVTSDGTNGLIQYASSDQGSTFDYVGISVAAALKPDVIAVDRGFLITYLVAGAGAEKLVGDAYTIYGTTYASAQPSTTDRAVVQDETGVLYSYVRTNGSANEITLLTSFDQGATWTASVSTSYASRSTVSTVYQSNYCAVSCRGTVLLLGNAAAPTTLYGPLSLFAWHMGGWTQVTLPRYNRIFGQATTIGYNRSYAAWELPENVGWTAAGVGTGTVDTSQARIIVTTAANTRIYSYAPGGTTTIATGIMACFEFEPVSGGSAGTNVVGFHLAIASGGAMYRVEGRISTTQWALYDASSAAQIGATQSLSGRTEVLIALQLASGALASVATWTRAVGFTGERDWVTGPAASTVTDGGAGANLVAWGNRAAGTAVSRWYRVQITEGDNVGQHLSLGQTNPTELYGRLFAKSPYVGDGVTIAANDGPAVLGDYWTISTRYDHEARRMTAIPSPRITWRSTSTAAQVLAYRWDSSLTLDTHGTKSLLGIAGFGSNIPQIDLHGYDADTTSWISIGSAVLGITGMHFARTGGSIRPHGTTQGTTPYLRHNEFAGATMRLDATYSHRINNHGDGKWMLNSPLTPTMILTSPNASDPATGTTGAIIPSQWLILLDLAGTPYSGIRLTIPAPTASIPLPAESYYEIGSLVIGRVYAFGQDTDWSRTIDLEDATEIAEARDRTTRSRSAAPPRRTVSIAWADGGLDMTGAERDGDPDIRRVSNDNGAGWNASGGAGTPALVEGLYRQTAGSNVPIVYIPRVAVGSGIRVYNRRTEMMLCRFGGPVSIETVLGEENQDELVRLASVPLVEEV